LCIIILWIIEVRNKLYQVHPDFVITEETQNKRELLFERINRNSIKRSDVTEHTGSNDTSSNEVSESSDNEISESSDNEISDLSDNEISDLSDNEISDLSDNEITESSDNEITESSDNEISESSDNEITESSDNEKADDEIRIDDYTYEYNNTPRRRRNYQLENIKRQARKVFIDKCNISKTMRETNITYDDMLESFLYYKD
jgi:hypothetical protein